MIFKSSTHSKWIAFAIYNMQMVLSLSFPRLRHIFDACIVHLTETHTHTAKSMLMSKDAFFFLSFPLSVSIVGSQCDRIKCTEIRLHKLQLFQPVLLLASISLSLSFSLRRLLFLPPNSICNLIQYHDIAWVNWVQ